MGGGRQRRPSKPSGGRRYTSGDLPAKNSSPESSGPHNGVNAIVGSAYSYSSSDDPSRPIHLSTSSVVAFMDPTPSSDPATPVPMYNYDPAIGGLGLGFHNEDGELEEEEEEDPYESEGKGEGFLSIGGVRVYTEDCSSPDEESGDSTGSDSSEEEEEEGESADESSSSDEDDDDSEVDDEMVEDYLEGIGGSSEILKSGWLAKKKNLEEQFLESESSSDDDDDDGDKLRAIEIMNVSQEYGMLKKKKIKFRKGKGQISSPMVEFGLSAAMDDLMFAKDPRNFSGRIKKKKALSQLSRSWPREGHRSKEHYGASGIQCIFCVDSFLY